MSLQKYEMIAINSLDIVILLTAILLFGFLKANFGPLSRGQPHSFDFNHWILTYLARRSLGALWRGLFPKPSSVSFNSEPFNSAYNALTHQVSLPEHSVRIVVLIYS